jgi:hypothetical protein
MKLLIIIFSVLFAGCNGGGKHTEVRTPDAPDTLQLQTDSAAGSRVDGTATDATSTDTTAL